MEIVLERKIRTDISTIGELSINGKFVCYILEDKDRGLTSEMTLEQIQQQKVYGKTAIPTGRYEVVISYSERFKKYLPLLLSVKGYDGIRMHSGNKSEDTLGCLLYGKTKNTDFVGKSKIAESEFLSIVIPFFNKEKVFITIK